MEFIGYYNDQEYGTLQLWEVRDESSEEWNARPDESGTNQQNCGKELISDI